MLYSGDAVSSMACVVQRRRSIFHGFFADVKNMHVARVLGHKICPNLDRFVTWSGLARNHGGDCIRVRLQNHVKNIASIMFHVRLMCEWVVLCEWVEGSTTMSSWGLASIW